jgi:hypothetical protein
MDNPNISMVKGIRHSEVRRYLRVSDTGCPMARDVTVWLKRLMMAPVAVISMRFAIHIFLESCPAAI